MSKITNNFPQNGCPHEERQQQGHLWLYMQSVEVNIARSLEELEDLSIVLTQEEMEEFENSGKVRLLLNEYRCPFCGQIILK